MKYTEKHNSLAMIKDVSLKSSRILIEMKYTEKQNSSAIIKDVSTSLAMTSVCL